MLILNNRLFMSSVVTSTLQPMPAEMHHSHFSSCKGNVANVIVLYHIIIVIAMEMKRGMRVLAMVIV